MAHIYEFGFIWDSEHESLYRCLMSFDNNYLLDFLKYAFNSLDMDYIKKNYAEIIIDPHSFDSTINDSELIRIFNNWSKEYYIEYYNDGDGYICIVSKFKEDIFLKYLYKNYKQYINKKLENKFIAEKI